MSSENKMLKTVTHLQTHFHADCLTSEPGCNNSQKTSVSNSGVIDFTRGI
jgi:hypothetical protein